jgi:NADPH:quinone reductase-like Zn-dependent oxidoreductase
VAEGSVTTTRSTEAWILEASAALPKPGLVLREVPLRQYGDHEALVKPLWGSWEGNMAHAVKRVPLDVCAKRGEPFVVLGNCGVVRVERLGKHVKGFSEGDCCLVITGCDNRDKDGYVVRAFAYDAPNTMGLLAKHTVVHRSQLIKIPEGTRHALQQWAAFGIKHLTAWSNWKAAVGCWRVIAPHRADHPRVCGWGGGVSLAELRLARLEGCTAAMTASSDARLSTIEAAGVIPIDRRPFHDLGWDSERYANDTTFRARYDREEKLFIAAVHQAFSGTGADIFIDNIGGALVRATSRALGRPGVLATAGWKSGGDITMSRPIECYRWHVHVHTNSVYRQDVETAVEFAEREGWLPTLTERPFQWRELPALVSAYEKGECGTYFPLFSVNDR